MLGKVQAIPNESLVAHTRATPEPFHNRCEVVENAPFEVEFLAYVRNQLG